MKQVICAMIFIWWYTNSTHRELCSSQKIWISVIPCTAACSLSVFVCRNAKGREWGSYHPEILWYFSTNLFIIPQNLSLELLQWDFKDRSMQFVVTSFGYSGSACSNTYKKRPLHFMCYLKNSNLNILSLFSFRQLRFLFFRNILQR